MKDQSAKRRAALQAFIDSYGRRKRNWICTKAKVSESAIRAFLKGDTAYLEEPTYEKLASWSHWTVAELKGDGSIPTPHDLVSRKTGTGEERDNAFLTKIGQTSHRTAESPESEGDDMGDRLFIEILDKLLELPPGHLRRLKRHIEAIEGGAHISPPKRGTAE